MNDTGIMFAGRRCGLASEGILPEIKQDDLMASHPVSYVLL